MATQLVLRSPDKATIELRAFANCDHTFVAWRPKSGKSLSTNCRGFALWRIPANGPAEIVETFVGPETEKEIPAGTHQASTVWPIQKFTWADYDAKPGGTYRYCVVSMEGETVTSIVQSTTDFSADSNEVTVDIPQDADVVALFNRGVVSTQYVARNVKASGKSLLSLVNPVDGNTNAVRDFLGGVLKERLLSYLAAQNAVGGEIYASLFELSDPEVIAALCAFGMRAHIILSNGSHTASKGMDPSDIQNDESNEAAQGDATKIIDPDSAVRKKLKASHVDVKDRLVVGEHFSHHKFIIFKPTAKSGGKEYVWTGSTNLTYGGICTQANNAILLVNGEVAKRYQDQWNELSALAGSYPPALVNLPNNPKSCALKGGVSADLWFSPNPKVQGNGVAPTKYGFHGDLEQCADIMRNAKSGILFLVFNPGTKGTLLNVVEDLITARPDLFIHGVANQDQTVDKKSLLFADRGTLQKVDPHDVLLPAAVSLAGKKASAKEVAATNAWVKLIKDYWQQENQGLGPVRVHSKVVVVDPLGPNSVVITGSHNLGPKASAVNDDNLLILKGDQATAVAYAVNIMNIYDQYRWRFVAHQAAKEGKPVNQWHGLRPKWRAADYLAHGPARELRFWLD